MYSNSGAQPMYRAEVRVDTGVHGFPYAASRRYLPPTLEPTFFEVVPGALDEYIIQAIRRQRPAEAEGNDDLGLVEFVRTLQADRAEIVVTFTDANGIRWYREEGGQLVRTDEEV